MVYTRNQPNIDDDLDVSQPILLANTNSADDYFGIDHYPFSNNTSNRGFHKSVTTPPGGSHLITAAGIPKFYAMQDTANIGVIQYSRQGNNAVPSPVTIIQSPSTPIELLPGQSSNMLDFTGVSRALVQAYAADLTSMGIALSVNAAFFFNGSSWNLTSTGNAIRIVPVGSILTVKNNSGTDTLSNVYWSIQLIRIEV